jgi:hypothetical protein
VNVFLKYSNFSVIQHIQKLKTSVQMNTYKLGPRSDENSQWKIKMVRFPPTGISFPCTGSPASGFCTGSLMSTNSLKICSLVYMFLAPLMWPPSYSYG